MKRVLTSIFLLFLVACGQPAALPSPTSAPQRTPVVRPVTPPADPGRLALRATPPTSAAPLLAEHRAQVERALARAEPLMLLDGLDTAQQAAWQIAVSDVMLVV